MKPTLEDYQNALEVLKEEDFTKSDGPRVNSINAALQGLGLDPIDAEARDEFERQLAEDIPMFEGADEDSVTIRLTHASSNPVPLHVHGVGSFSIRVGQEATLPVEALEALENSDAKFEIIKQGETE